MRVLSIATLFPDASRPNFGLFVERSLRALAAQGGIELLVAAPNGLPPFPLSLHPHYRARSQLPRQEQWNGLDVIRPRFALLPGMGAARNAAAIARSLLPLVRGRSFDVIDAEFFFPDGVAAMHLARALGLPYSIKARGSDISHFGHQRATRRHILDAARSAAGLLAVSAAMRADMARIGIDAEKIDIHYTGLDAERFNIGDRAAARAALGFDARKRLLTVGALIERKGQALVIEALKTLPDADYLLAGEGEEKERYRALAKRLGVAERVHFLGAVPHADLPQLYRAVDLVAMPSASEGIANAWVEALACGTPLLVGDIPGAAELLASPDGGRIVERTPAAIAAAARVMLAAPPAPSAVAASLGGRFDWDRNGQMLASHLLRCAGR